CGRPAEECMDLPVAAVELRVLGEVSGSLGHYRFAHGLLCEVLRDDLSPTKKMRLHQQIGEVIEDVHAGDLEPHLAELAYHYWEAACSGAGGKAAEYGRKAGDRATSLLAYEEAAFHYRRALDALEEPGCPDEQARGDLYLALGKAEWWSGNRQAARSALRQAAKSARKCKSPFLLAHMALTFGDLSDPLRVDSELTGFLEAALAGLPAGENTLRVRLLARLAAGLLPDPESGPRRDALSREAVAAARRIGDRATLARALIERHTAMRSPEGLEERFLLTREAMVTARGTGNR